VCLRGLSVSKQSISALLCRLVQSTTILLSAAARTVIANSSATGDVDALLDKQPSRRLTILQVPLKHGQVGHHAPSSFIQGRPFPKTAPWHIYKNRAGKRQDLPRRLGARSAIQAAYPRTTYNTNEDSARPPPRQKQEGSGRPRKPMSRPSRPSHLNSSVLL
jgi:hypothetical protein